MDFKNTLINLHRTFPEYDLDTLIKIIECVVDQDEYLTSKVSNPISKGLKVRNLDREYQVEEFK